MKKEELKYDIKKRKVVIIGGGLSGSLLAKALAAKSTRYEVVEVLEKRRDSRKEATTEGKSINLSLSERGLTALKSFGMREKALKLGIPMYGRLLHLEGQSELVFQKYGVFQHQYNYSISRKMLNDLLMDEAEAAGALFHFEVEITELNIADGIVSYINEQKEAVTIRYIDLIIGADGAFSRVRLAMQRSAQ